MLLIVGFSIHWWTTGRESSVLIGVGVTLMLTGSIQSAYERAQRKLYKGNAPEETRLELEEDP